jgi:hypothetical protein
MDTDMRVASFGIADSDPTLADKKIAGELLAPRQRVVNSITHYNLYED